MTTHIENKFIPPYLFSSVILAVVSPYLAILLRDLGYSPLWVGILLGINSGAGIAGPMLFGHLADRTGRYRPFLIISCMLPALMIIPMIHWVHPAVSAILMAFFAFGVRSGIPLIDAITTIQIGKAGNYGRIRIWGSIGFVLVTLSLQLTPFMKPHNATNIAMWIIVASIASMIPFALLPRTLLRTSAEHHAESVSGGKTIPILSIYVLGGFGIIFLCNFAMAAVYTYFPLYLTEVIQWDVVGLMFAIATTSEIPIIFISVRLIRRYGSLPLLALAAAGITLRLLIWAFLPFKPCIVVSQLTHSLCFGMFHPAAVHFTASVFSAKKRGLGMSLYTALGAGLPSLIGNIAGGAIVETASYHFLFTLYAAITAVAVLIFFTVRLRGKTTPPTT